VAAASPLEPEDGGSGCCVRRASPSREPSAGAVPSRASRFGVSWVNFTQTGRCPPWMPIIDRPSRSRRAARRAFSRVRTDSPARTAAALHPASATPECWPRTSRSAPPELDELTARELEVLRLLAGGRSNAEIAGALFLARRPSRHTSITSSPISASATVSKPSPSRIAPASWTTHLEPQSCAAS